MIAAAAIIRFVTRVQVPFGTAGAVSLKMVPLAAVGLLALAAPHAAAQTTGGTPAGTGFVAGLSDVPVMPGLSAGGDQPLVFDKPGARIVESVLAGPVAQRAVLSFYNQTLPQLGWAIAGRNGAGRGAGHEARFQREGEELSVDVREGGGRTTVHFRLSPQ